MKTKNKPQKNTHLKTFQRNPNKQYIKKFRFYPSFLYAHLDRWLKEMSRKGWHIVHSGLFYFWFEKGAPAEKAYFTYGLSTQEGKYSLTLRSPLLEKTYGVSKKASKINANTTKKYQIVEIDTETIDIESDIGYRELLHDRNRLYGMYCIRNLCTLALSVAAIMLIFMLIK